MWFKSEGKLEVLWALREISKRKLLLLQKRKTIPRIVAEVHLLILQRYERKFPDREPLSISQIERLLYDFRDEGILKEVGSISKSKARNGSVTLYEVNIKKIDKTFVSEFKDTPVFEILKDIWTLLEF